MLAPGGRIGIFGGGQLGRMLAQAAARMGFRPLIFTPEKNPPAAQAAQHLCAAYEDEDALAAFCRQCDILTYEFENIPPAACHFAAGFGEGGDLFPCANAIEIASDRLAEKKFLTARGLQTAPFAALAEDEPIDAALAQIGGAPASLKARRGGYDGKGQCRIARAAEATAARQTLPGAAVLEKEIAFATEAAIIGARGAEGEFLAYDLTRTFHEKGILRRAEAGARFPPGLAARAQTAARQVAAGLDYRGVLAVEFFLGQAGELWVNEIAPRVHNAGHWTLEACIASQFEQHIRAICGWPLASPARHADARMENLIGDEVAQWQEIAARPGVALHLYGKAAIKPGRKMGHINRLYPLGALPE